MKKILISLVLSLTMVSSSFAATSITIAWTNAGYCLHGDKTTASATTPLIGKTSSGVAVGAFVVTSGAGYAIITQHKSGTKMFGSSFDSTSIYTAPIDSTKVGVAGGNVLSVPTTATSADFLGSSWSSM